MAIPADSIARAIAYAIEQPAEVEIDEVSSGPRRRISNAEHKESIVTIREQEKHCEHWCLQVSRMALLVSVMLASFQMLAKTNERKVP